MDSWPERQQAALDAYEAGAHDVNNHLHVLAPAAHEPKYRELFNSLTNAHR